jgi:ABC-type nitrate/sulfonate/bicarbonate transport system substrate-binding protein
MKLHIGNKIKHHRRLRWALAALVVLHWSAWVSEQPTKVAIGYSGISADQLVIWVAKDAGIFAKNNIDAQTVYFSGGILSVTAMVSGDTPVIQASDRGSSVPASPAPNRSTSSAALRPWTTG